MSDADVIPSAAPVAVPASAPAAAPVPGAAVATPEALEAVDALQLRRDRDAALARANRSDAAAANATRVAQTASAEAAQARGVAEDALLRETTTSLEGAQNSLTGLKERYKAAFSNGDAEALADINIEIGKQTALVDRLTIQKTDIETQRARPAPAGTMRPAAEAPRWWDLNQSPQEFLDSRTPETRQWLLDHQQFFTDRRAHDRIRDADAEADRLGLAKDTPEYFQHLNGRFDVTQQMPAARATTAAAVPAAAATPAAATTLQPAAPATDPGAARPAPARAVRHAAPPAAAPSRDGARGPGARSGERHITADHIHWAQVTGVTPEEYYDEQQRLVAEGEISDRFRS